ncbi:hypothetical protein N7478_002160 [Penicillium angulare]|uniref:uncharacterized protein n=1 Tax=Penicillium angulare TaxID=116970 RepID=UPI00253FE682|nr:uncharacterized protein N7478_002160 [Penicillium angulare]KAJ5289130.1 hypothetical protein N7478_002160 [Penicillium angulare]
MTQPEPAQVEPPGLKIINASLFRSGTKSMARAYKILGFNAHHGLLESVTDTPWSYLLSAAEAAWHSPNSPIPTPLTRSDWDKIWAQHNVSTDLGSPFSLELIKIYPSAKVVIVQRDFETWWPSYRREVLDRVMIEPWATINSFIGDMIRLPAVRAMRKIHLGFFGANDRDQILLNARRRYEAFYDEIRDVVPAERKLEYKLGEGWEPLCEFLGVPVPDVPFPRENDASDHGDEVKKRYKLIYGALGKILVPVLAGVGVWWYLS